MSLLIFRLPALALCALLATSSCAAEPASANDAGPKPHKSPHRAHSASAEVFPELDLAITVLKSEQFAGNPALSDAVIRHKVRPRESVDSVLKKYYSQLPFRPSSLIALVTELNPDALPVKSSSRLIAGRTLVLPSPSLLRSILLTRPSGAIASLPQADASIPQNAIESADWIHYP